MDLACPPQHPGRVYRNKPRICRPALCISQAFAALVVLFRRARRVKAWSESYTTRTCPRTFTATNSPSRINVAISSFGRLSWKLASATETSSGLSVLIMCATVGTGSVSVKYESNSQRAKTTSLVRFYAAFVSRIDLSVSEFSESSKFSFAPNFCLFALNHVAPRIAFQIGRLVFPRAAFPRTAPQRCDTCIA
jgi:hypothetical protein